MREWLNARLRVVAIAFLSALAGMPAALVWYLALGWLGVPALVAALVAAYQAGRVDARTEAKLEKRWPKPAQG